MSSLVDSTAGVMVDLSGEDQYRPGVWIRGKSMIVAALKEAGIKEGSFRFQPDGPSDDLKNHTLPVLEVQPTSFPSAIFVRIKSGGKSDTTMKGMLRVPPGIDRTQFLRALAPVLQRQNDLGWKGVFDEIEPGPPREIWTQAVRPAAINGAPKTPPPASPVPLAKTQSPAPPPKPLELGRKPPPAPAATSVPPPGTDPNVLFLLAILEGSKDGVFKGAGLALKAATFFPNEPAGYHRIGAVRKLEGLGYIRRLPGTGVYQVEESFLKKHPIPGLRLEPQPAAVPKERKSRDDPTNPLTPGRQKPEAQKSKRVSIDVANLLAQRRALDEQISLARAELVAKVSEAEASLLDAKQRAKDAKQAVTDANNRLFLAESEITETGGEFAQAQAALADFDQQMKTALESLAAIVSK